MNNYYIIILSCLFVFSFSRNAQGQGEQLFMERCRSCHTVGGGKLVGPDLADVQTRRTEEWILKFVPSSQTLINSGDSTAVAVFEQNNKVVMPDQNLNPDQIKSIIDYITKNSSASSNRGTTGQNFNTGLVNAADIANGKNIFDGSTPLTNGGPPCISCHNVNNITEFNGGLLAKDLTTVFSRLGAAGIDGIVRNPPFPAMVNAFGTSPLTDQEISAILSYFYDSDSKGASQTLSFLSQFVLFIGIFLELDIALVILLVFWQRVKKRSVNFI